VTHPRVTSSLSSFDSNHPLTFLSRNTTARKLTNLPPPLTHLRGFHRSTPPSQTLTPERNFAKWSLTQLYLKATGNFDSSCSFSSGDSFSFLKEGLETASLHKIMCFCVPHSVGVGHDTT
jgi:hypothetical protein